MNHARIAPLFLALALGAPSVALSGKPDERAPAPHPNAAAYDHANENARFKRDEETEAPKAQSRPEATDEHDGPRDRERSAPTGHKNKRR